MKITRVVLIAVVALVLVAGSVWAGRFKTESINVASEGAEKVALEFDIGAAEITIGVGDMDNIVEGEIEFDSRSWEFRSDYEIRRGTGYLLLESEHFNKRNIDTEDNILDLTISDHYEYSVEVDIGACDAEIDLGGLKIDDLILDVGAADITIDFSKPNPIVMERFSVDAGAAELTLLNVGNANFEEFEFDGGVGEFEIDFRGDYSGESEITADIGLGSLELTLPDDVAVRVEVDGDGWLSTVDFHNDDLDEVDDDVYETDDFDDADDRIIVRLSVGMGSIDIYFK